MEIIIMDGYMTCLCIILCCCCAFFFVWLLFRSSVFHGIYYKLLLLLFSLYFIRKMFIVNSQSLEQKFLLKAFSVISGQWNCFSGRFFSCYFHSRKLVQIFCHNSVWKLRLYRKGVKVIKWMVFKKEQIFVTFSLLRWWWVNDFWIAKQWNLINNQLIKVFNNENLTSF